MPSRDLAPAARPRIRTVSRMTSLLSPAMPRRVLGAIMGNSINSKERGVTKSASKDDKAGGRTSMEWSFLLGSTPSAEKSSGSPGAFSGEFFGRRGTFSRKRGKTPAVISVFGEEGILEDTVGEMPKVIKALGEEGVLQTMRGPTPKWALAEEVEERARVAKSECDALVIAEFVEKHPDAQMLPSGKIKCTTTGHEMPLNLFWLSAHWEGKKYAKAVAKKAKAEQRAQEKTKPKVSKQQKKQLALAKKAERSANFPATGEPVRWTKTAVSGVSSSEMPADPFDDAELWNMADVAQIGEARARLNAAALGLPEPKNRRSLSRPPDGWPPATTLEANRSTPIAATTEVATASAETMEPAQSPLAGAVANIGERTDGAKGKRMMQTPMANKKASKNTSMAMQAEDEEAVAACVAACVAAATGTDTDPAVDVADSNADDTDFPCVRASYAPKPMASDWARLFKAKPASEVSETPPEPTNPPPEDLPMASIPKKRPPPPPKEDNLQQEVVSKMDTTSKAAPAAAVLTAKEVKAMKVAELRSALEARGCATDGLKPVLTARLLEVIASEEAGQAAASDESAPAQLLPEPDAAPKAVRGKKITPAKETPARPLRTSTRINR